MSMATLPIRSLWQAVNRLAAQNMRSIELSRADHDALRDDVTTQDGNPATGTMEKLAGMSVTVTATLPPGQAIIETAMRRVMLVRLADLHVTWWYGLAIRS